jgi:hypothetical protein
MFDLYELFCNFTEVLSKYGGYEYHRCDSYEYYRIINEDSIQYIEVLDNLEVFN